ncbi:hypothetical protein [Bacillus songklensis]
MAHEHVVRWLKEDGIATVTIDNPPVNTLSVDVITQLTEVIEEVERDPEVIVVRSIFN